MRVLAPNRSHRLFERLEERILFAVVSGHVDLNGDLPFTRVELFQWDANDVETSHWAYTDANGNYSITTPTTTGQMELVVELAWDPNQGAGGRDAQLFQITYNSSMNAVEFDSDLVNFGTTLNADLTDTQWFILSSTQNKHVQELLTSYELAIPYYSFAYFGGFEGGTGLPNNGAGVLGNLIAQNPVTMHEWDTTDFIGVGSGAYYFDFNIYMDNTPTGSGSYPDNLDQPMNNEWHETSHYFMELLESGMPFFDGDFNHDGYSNPSTVDSFTEGFAEFLPCQYLRLTNQTLRGLDANFYQYSGGDTDISLNTLAWSDEEIAVASLLWTLTDQSPGKVGLDTADLFDVMIDQKPQSIADLYAELKTRNVGNVGSPLTRLDRAFIDRGFFSDPYLRFDAKLGIFRDADGLPTLEEPEYTDGDIIGFAANRNPLNTIARITRDGLSLPKLDITSQPTKGWVKSAPFSPVVVHIEETNGDTITLANYNVTLKVFSGGGKLLGTITSAAVNGVATFNDFQFSAPGNIVLQAICGNYTKDTSNPITVILPASKYVFKQIPATTVAGVNFTNIIVEARNAKNQVVTDYTGNVTLSINTGPIAGAIDGTLTVALVNGVAAFAGLSADIAGKYGLKATDGTLNGLSAKFTVTPDLSTAHLVSLLLPTNAPVGKTFATKIKANILDQFDNLVTKTKGPAILSIVNGPGIIKGAIRKVPSSGVYTYSGNTFTVAGNYDLKILDATLGDPTPLTFSVTIDQATTAVKVPTVKAAGYLSTANTILTTKLTSNAPTTIAFTGSATIEDDLHNVLATAVALANGTLKWTLTGVTPGTYLCTVVYPGDASHTDIESTAFTLKFL